jgi:hypothetical protein
LPYEIFIKVFHKPAMKFLPIMFMICIPMSASSWGFFAHQKINYLAVFTLPPEMISFYKRNIVFITENAVNPDKRRYAVKEEAARHYIDLDVYGDSAAYTLPRYWKEAVRKFSEDTLQAYGIVPWYIVHMKHQLTEAFQEKDAKRILRLSADIAHYIADANVPLHTTQNYNGQLTGQKGIHGFWESRLPELYFNSYDFFVGKAQYLYSPQQTSWRAVLNAHNAVDSVLLFERQLNASYPEDRKYSFEERGGKPVKVYSKEYSKAYHLMLGGQVEKQMRASVKMVGDFWFTCWVDAGQPDLNLLDAKFSEQEMKVPDVHPEGDCNH